MRGRGNIWGHGLFFLHVFGHALTNSHIAGRCCKQGKGPDVSSEPCLGCRDRSCAAQGAAGRAAGRNQRGKEGKGRGDGARHRSQLGLNSLGAQHGRRTRAAAAPPPYAPSGQAGGAKSPGAAAGAGTGQGLKTIVNLPFFFPPRGSCGRATAVKSEQV